MGDEDGPITKVYFNGLMAQMAAMMEQIQSNNAKLESLPSGATSTTPPEPVDTSAKDDQRAMYPRGTSKCHT
jgi:hypothetical protein